jgi:hypothetical protein
MSARPAYETPQDLANEEGVARVLARRWSATALKLKRFYPIDYAFCREERYTTSHNGRPVLRSTAAAFAEIKTRTYTWEQLDRLGGYALSLEKWSAAERLCSMAGLPFIVAVCAVGDLRYAVAGDFSHDGVTYGGRSDRGDPSDKEPLILLNVARFKPVRL